MLPIFEGGVRLRQTRQNRGVARLVDCMCVLFYVGRRRNEGVFQVTYNENYVAFKRRY